MIDTKQQLAPNPPQIKRRSATLILPVLSASAFDDDFNDEDVVFDAGPAVKNPAVEHCIGRYVTTLTESYDTTKSRAELEIIAVRAFRDAMPPLSGTENIQDFIACVAYGMLTDVIPPEIGTRLLYAAQVAQTACKRKPAIPPANQKSAKQSALPAGLLDLLSKRL